MKGVITWIVVWMLFMGLILAVNSPGELAKDLEAVSQAPFVFVSAFIALYIFIVVPSLAVISKETTKTMKARYEGEIAVLKATIEADEKENKRLETKITELEKQLQGQSNETPQPLLNSVSVVETSKPLKLLYNSRQDDQSQSELKSQALKIVDKLYRAIEIAKSQALQTTNGLEIGIDFLYVPRNDLKDAKYKNIIDSILRYYSDDLHDIAVELKGKILVSDRTKLLSIGDYTNPQGLREIELIAKDLKNIANT